jgi:hypothetical protein
MMFSHTNERSDPFSPATFVPRTIPNKARVTYKELQARGWPDDAITLLGEPVEIKGERAYYERSTIMAALGTPAIRELLRQNTLVTTTQLKHRGWTAAAIKRFLDPPDLLKKNYLYPSGPAMRLYRVGRVEEAERTPHFVHAKTSSAKRSAASKRSWQLRTSVQKIVTERERIRDRSYTAEQLLAGWTSLVTVQNKDRPLAKHRSLAWEIGRLANKLYGINCFAKAPAHLFTALREELQCLLRFGDKDNAEITDAIAALKHACSVLKPIYDVSPHKALDEATAIAMRLQRKAQRREDHEQHMRALQEAKERRETFKRRLATEEKQLVARLCSLLQEGHTFDEAIDSVIPCSFQPYRTILRRRWRRWRRLVEAERRLKAVLEKIDGGLSQDEAIAAVFPRGTPFSKKWSTEVRARLQRKGLNHSATERVT